VGLYHALIRPVLFSIDSERAHAAAIRAGELAGASRSLCGSLLARCTPADPRLVIEVAGLRMATPLGLAAGFDKSAHAVPLLSSLGFGHVEVGSVSADASDGNPRPRLFRLPSDGAIVVNYGLPNDGAERIAQRLAGRPRTVPLGINIVSTNRGADAAQESDDAVIGDYLRAVDRLAPQADYLCLNLSCPNTRDGRGFFHEPRRLTLLLDALDARRIGKPLFLKVAPFAEIAEIERFLATVSPCRSLSGFSVNLPPGKPAGLGASPDALARMPGAVSGRPAAAAADRTLAELYRRMDRHRHVLIGSGGVFDARDAYRKIRLGASMVQLLTALVYEGPAIAATINRGFAGLLAADGVHHVGEVVGVDVRP